ncbi:PPR repeat [Geosmithia morbida]|uniref:PPR repeat n=1 Tax=Geosmithia morbida TaxID=1094350 RepID=A0A9P4Z179_9HYPO|nr:PPR repeat [Geosmithia morbida]KAF4126705.1 PPR repeat [Geosmithia morbida]
MPTIYSSLYANFIRQGSTFVKSATAHGYAQSVVAATHPHLLNSQNRPVFGRRHTNRLSRLSALQLTSAFHTDKSSSAAFADPKQTYSHGGLDGYFEALKSKESAGEELDNEWTQYEFPKRLEWKPSSSTVLTNQEELAAGAEKASDEVAPSRPMTPEEQAALAHIDAALEKEVELRRQAEEEGIDEPVLRPRTATPGSLGRSATPPVDPQSQSYADHLDKLSAAGRYAEIPAVFEAMLATGVKPIAGSYNALLVAAIHIPSQKSEVVSKALDVYTDMVRRRVSPDADTYNILVGLLASRSLEVSSLMSGLKEKLARFGGMDEPGKFMLASHEFEYAILSEDDRLDLAMKLFDSSIDADMALYTAETYHQLICACAQAGRISDMLRLFEHMELAKTAPFAAVFPAMISAFASSGDLVSAVECYNEYRALAIADDMGKTTLHDRLDAQVYASVINAYVISDKIEGAMKFFQKIVGEYGVRAIDIKDALVSAGFVKGFLTRGIYQEAFYWAQSVTARGASMNEIATAAADNGDVETAHKAYAHIPSGLDATSASIAMLAMSVRQGDVASAAKFWHVLSAPETPVDAAMIEPTTMYAVALIGSGQVAEGLAQSEVMFQKIRASRPELAEEVEEGVEFIAEYMAARAIADPRELTSPVSTQPQQSMTSSPFLSTPTTASFEDSFDPYAHSTDFKGSSLIADDIEGSHGRKGPRLGDAMNRLRNMRRAGRHPRYITYAKLISAAAREGKMEQCQEILSMARSDVPLMPQYAVVRYGWSSILDAMVGACLSVGNRGRAEQYHQELLDMGSAPSANTFGLYITTLKESTKTFDEATEAVRIFHRAQAEGVEPSSFLYNALIGKLGKARRIDDCLFYFSEMRALGIKPTSVTYGTVVNALCRVSDEKSAEELFDEMESMPNYKARPAPYNSMMQFFLTTKRNKAKVLAYYERMKARGIAPTAHTYKLLVDTHASLEPVDMEAAEAVLAAIRASGQHTEPVHYASLIHARGCVLHDVDGARSVFDSVARGDAEAAGVPLNASLFQALFEAMVANHRVSESEGLLADMRARGIPMTAYIANTLIHGWTADKKIEKAQAIYDSVSRESREPSTYEAMTRAYLAVGQRDDAKRVVGEMLSRGYPSAVVNKVLELLGQDATA